MNYSQFCVLFYLKIQHVNIVFQSESNFVEMCLLSSGLGYLETGLLIIIL